jgi:hypothetical protein
MLHRGSTPARIIVEAVFRQFASRVTQGRLDPITIALEAVG